jgi:hypothetical protein
MSDETGGNFSQCGRWGDCLSEPNYANYSAELNRLRAEMQA